ncbi:hypothetical protein JS756_02965 [Streptomyces actuosus]|uniref:DNA-binding protein n=1 Tax=Streptomyces actuosus TaxID=1885 RepID=A0ABS2VJ10_STRAS|nr:hypothetical protein [Streptomyces actuosus]
MTTTSTEIAARRGMQYEEVVALPVAFDLETANRALGIGRTKGFELAKRGEYPVPVRRDGRTYRVNRADLLRELGMDPHCDGAGVAAPTPSDENAPVSTSSH